MNTFLILLSLVSVAVARPSVVHVSSPLLGPTSASASASASASLPQSLPILRLTPSAPLGPDGRVLETLEVALARAEHEAAHRRAQAELARANARNALALSPALLSSSSASASASASSLASVAPLSAGGRVVDILEVSLAKAAHAAAHRNEQLRLANQAVRAAQAQAQAQQHGGANSLLSTTRLAQSLFSVSPSGAVQLVESPQLSVARAQEQAAVANLRLLAQRARSPLLVDSDGQLLGSSVLLL